MNITRMGIDLAKNVFQLHGVDKHEKVAVRKQLKRAELLEYFANKPPMLIGIEACGGAHYWARMLGKLGHTVKAMAPQHVKAYVKSQKNDKRDAEAICEAVSRPTMRFVAIKSEEQQHSSGGKEKPGGISKCGDKYLRTLLIHGARSAMRCCDTKTDKRSFWINALIARRNKNIATVAMANKNARIIWSILTRGESYRAAA